MSLQVEVNIVKGWPSPSIVEKSLPSADSEVALSQGDIVVLSNDGWVLADNATHNLVAEVGTPFIIMVDSTDPSTNRGAFTNDYQSVGYGAIHGIGLNNALEIETTNFKTNGVATSAYSIGTELTVGTGDALKGAGGAGELIVATSGKVVYGRISRAAHSIGTKTYITFIPCDPYLAA